MASSALRAVVPAARASGAAWARSAAIRPRTAVMTSVRSFSTPVEQDEKAAEEAAIFASMQEELDKLNVVNNVGHLAVIPDLPDTLPANRKEVATLDHTPESVTERECIIMQKSQHAMTSGSGKTLAWVLFFPNLARWTNQLTGWTSSADPMTTVELSFDSKEDAIAFADKKGFSYRVKDKKKNRDRKIGTNYYAHNFLPAAVEAKLRTEGKNTAHFVNPKGAMSNYFRPLKFHGDGQVRQHGPNPYEKSMVDKGQVGGGGPGSKSASDTGGDPLKLTKAGAVRMGDSDLEGRNHPGHWSDKKV
mmetsp:Transcript_9538/g.24243  ORF Transcript_9538/g.24243 Transcript_9538/m.24243 type:complete len:304 (+) Transcript_9538:293-1204(+)